jgi:hypothetical protein
MMVPFIDGGFRLVDEQQTMRRAPTVCKGYLTSLFVDPLSRRFVVASRTIPHFFLEEGAGVGVGAKFDRSTWGRGALRILPKFRLYIFARGYLLTATPTGCELLGEPSRTAGGSHESANHPKDKDLCRMRSMA